MAKSSDFYLCIVLIGLLIATTNAKNYYKILGINRKASDKEIKKAFREKARHLHPDKNKSPNAEAQFREVAEAYEILSDPQKRKNYDMGGSSSFNQQGSRANNFNFNFDDLFKQFESDIFGQMNMFDDDLKGHFGHHFANHQEDLKGHFGSHFTNHGHASGGGFSFDDLFDVRHFTIRQARTQVSYVYVIKSLLSSKNVCLHVLQAIVG